jgi:cobyrinic acid a,c-diamide synthase
MRLHLGYRNIDAEGIALKGHEFHYSEVRPVNDGVKNIGKALNAKGQPTGTALYRHKNLIAGYTHLYWGERNIFRLLFNDFQ